jgi:hypothetical protein
MEGAVADSGGRDFFISIRVNVIAAICAGQQLAGSNRFPTQLQKVHQPDLCSSLVHLTS